MRYVTIYFKLMRMNLISGMQYKGWPMMTLQVLIVVLTEPIGLVFLFMRFGSVGNWSAEKILLVYAAAVTSFGLAETFNRGFDYFPWRMLKQGGLDRLLLRPCPIVPQVAGSVCHIHRLSRVIGGLAIIAWCLSRTGVTVDAAGAVSLALGLAGGFLMYSGVFILTSGVAFFTIEGLDWIYILTNVSYQVTRCPADYMPLLLKRLFTFALPVLVISYYPMSNLCGWGETYWKGLAALPAGAAFMALSFAVWSFGLKRYKSAGS